MASSMLYNSHTPLRNRSVILQDPSVTPPLIKICPQESNSSILFSRLERSLVHLVIVVNFVGRYASYHHSQPVVDFVCVLRDIVPSLSVLFPCRRRCYRLALSMTVPFGLTFAVLLLCCSNFRCFGRVFFRWWSFDFSKF
jgi:hypothetical protein